MTQNAINLSLNEDLHSQSHDEEDEAAENNVAHTGQAIGQIGQDGVANSGQEIDQIDQGDAANEGQAIDRTIQGDAANDGQNGDEWIPEHDNNPEDHEFEIDRHLRLQHEADAEAANLHRRLLAPRDEIRNRVRGTGKKNQFDELKEKQIELVKVQLNAQKLLQELNRENVVNMKIAQEESREKLKLAEFQRKIAELEYKHKLREYGELDD